MDVRKHYIRFRATRIALEQERFNMLFAPFVELEERMLSLFLKNGMMDYLDEVLLCEATAADRQSFYFRWPTKVPPKYVFNIPMEQIPMDLCSRLHLYSGGYVHLSYADVPAWIIHYTLQIADVQLVLNPITKEQDRHGLLYELARCVVAHYVKYPVIEQRQQQPRFASIRKGFRSIGGENKSILIMIFVLCITSFLPVTQI